MLTIDINPVLVHIGPFALSWYGLIVAGAIAVGVRVVYAEAHRRGIRTESLADVVTWVIVGGAAAARDRPLGLVLHQPHADSDAAERRPGY